MGLTAACTFALSIEERQRYLDELYKFHRREFYYGGNQGYGEDNPHCFSTFPAVARFDREVAIVAVAQWAGNLQHVGSALQADEQVIRMAMFSVQPCEDALHAHALSVPSLRKKMKVRKQVVDWLLLCQELSDVYTWQSHRVNRSCQRGAAWRTLRQPLQASHVPQR